ncbi:hypothetical protein SO802_022860 [Lithocarpus litseifolius]|uniref:Uncharacterized protein n=1 Tax=Lithocarpus litseifolius TaxID=425828 RepID=A0AAW2C6G2_9ROSI
MFTAVLYCICREHNIRIFQHYWKHVYVVQQEVEYAEESGEESTELLVSEVNYLSPSSQELFSFVNQFKVVLESCDQNFLPCHSDYQFQSTACIAILSLATASPANSATTLSSETSSATTLALTLDPSLSTPSPTTL